MDDRCSVCQEVRADGVLLATEKGRVGVVGGWEVGISAYLVRVMDGGCSVYHEVKTDGVLLTREKGRVEVKRGAGSCFWPFSLVGIVSCCEG